MRLPRASTPVALASAAALAMQLALGALLLRAFAPGAVGEFSVVAQVAFYWMTLALAQGQLKLLADSSQDTAAALGRNLRAALARWALLVPLGWWAVHLSGASVQGAWAWATAMAVLQLGWAFAQAATLRSGSTRAMAWVRVVPPAFTLLAVGAFSLAWPQAGAPALLLAATAGYACGCCWLLPFRGEARAAKPPATSQEAAAGQRDDRRTALRLLHTAADALIGTAILLVWQRAYGAAEAGFLAVLLRIFGFVPAVTHAAWAQVLLAQASSHRRASLVAGAFGAAVTAALGLLCAAAVWLGWVGPAWHGLGAYLLPVVCWQASACVLAAVSHLPFQQDQARRFSWLAIGYDLLQLVLLCGPVLLLTEPEPSRHIAAFGYASSVALLGLCAWIMRGRLRAQGPAGA